MAVPTITSVTPALGPTGGGRTITIIGTNFQTWQIPPPNGMKTGPVWPTVRVRFGGVACRVVQVPSTTKLYVQPPPTPLPIEKPAFGEGLVSVEVAHLDVDGNVITGELATLPNAYTYRRVQLAHNSDLSRLVRQLALRMQAEIIPNVSVSTHTDYDPQAGDGLDTLGIAETPAIALLGPKLVENRFHSLNQRGQTQLGGGLVGVRREPYTVDLQFQLLAVSDKALESLNLIPLVTQFFMRNRHISMLADPDAPSQGEVEYELVWMADGAPEMGATPNEANLKQFSGRFAIRGFDIEDLTGFLGSQELSRTAQIVEDPLISTEQMALEDDS